MVEELSKIIKCQSLIRKYLVNNISIKNPILIKRLENKLTWYHSGLRFPVKAEIWEDIWEQSINLNNSEWIGGGHQSGADTIHNNSKQECQNKSGTIKNNIVSITSHRTKNAGSSIEEKLDFISEKRWDKYVLLSRDKKDWKNGIKSYQLMVFNSSLINFRELTWEKYIPKKGKNKGKHNGGYIGNGDSDKFTAKIDGSGSSYQLHININIDYIGGYHKFIIP